MSFTVHLHGSVWEFVPTPEPRAREWLLYDVEALGPASARAVGAAGASAVTLRWDGSAWRRIDTPRSASHLFAVDRIPGSRRLVAVGVSKQGHGLVLRWTGSRWREHRLPRSTRVGALRGVDVVSRRLAWAVGDAGGRGVILRLTPSGWTRVEAPRLRGVQVHDVSALRPDRAFAVAGSRRLLRWNGRNWKTVPRFWARSIQLQAIDAGGGAAWVTGVRLGTTVDDIRPFAMRWHRRWRIVPVRDVANAFYEVSVGGGCVWTAGALSEGESNSAVFRRCA
jgi:hypothetical protein